MPRHIPAHQWSEQRLHAGGDGRLSVDLNRMANKLHLCWLALLYHWAGIQFSASSCILTHIFSRSLTDNQPVIETTTAWDVVMVIPARFIDMVLWPGLATKPKWLFILFIYLFFNYLAPSLAHNWAKFCNILIDMCAHTVYHLNYSMKFFW